MAIDFTAQTPPPAKSAKTADRPMRTSKSSMPKSEPRIASGKQGAREEAVNGIFQLTAFGLVMAGQQADAGALAKHGGSIAHEAAKVAETSASLGSAIDYITEAGPYAGLITATMPLVLQLLANHKVMKAETLSGAGVVPPETLSAQVKADMARQQIQALRTQQEAEQEVSHLLDEQKLRTPQNPNRASDRGPETEAA